MCRRKRGAAFEGRAGLCVFVAASLLTSAAAFAQAAATDERHIGTFEIKGSGPPDGDRLNSPPAEVSPSAPQAAAEKPRASSETAALFDQAEAALETGDTMRAQRLLEQLVARYPDSPDSSSARKLLADMYRGLKPDIAAKAPNEAVFPQRPSPVPPSAASETATQTPPSTAAPPATPPATTVQETQTPPLPGKDPQAKPVIPKMLSQDKERYDAPRNTELEKKFRIEAGDRIFFAAGSSDLGARARTALSAQAKWLAAHPDVEALIEGHSDEPGSDQENKILSQQRAEAVRARLIEEGVVAERITVKALGRKERVATCSDPECRVQNRRAVTVVFPVNGRSRILPKAPAQTTSVLPVQPMAVSDAEALGNGVSTSQAGPDALHR